MVEYQHSCLVYTHGIPTFFNVHMNVGSHLYHIVWASSLTWKRIDGPKIAPCCEKTTVVFTLDKIVKRRKNGRFVDLLTVWHNLIYQTWNLMSLVHLSFGIFRWNWIRFQYVPVLKISHLPKGGFKVNQNPDLQFSWLFPLIETHANEQPQRRRRVPAFFLSTQEANDLRIWSWSKNCRRFWAKFC